MSDWTDVCAADDIDEDDQIRFDQGDRTYAIYRTEDDAYYATDGLCTHEKVHLADGLLMGTTIECPMHNGRFDITNGAALRAPVCEDLATYKVEIREGRVMVLLPPSA